MESLIEKYLNGTISESEEKDLERIIGEALNINDNNIIEYFKLHLVSEKNFKSSIIGFLEEEYSRRKDLIDCDIPELKDYLMSCIADRLRDVWASFNGDWYSTTGMNLIIWSLDETHKYVYSEELDEYLFFIFDEECVVDIDDKILNTASDAVLCFKDLENNIEHLEFE